VENLSQCHFVLYRFLVDQPGIEPRHAVKEYVCCYIQALIGEEAKIISR